MQNRDRLNGRLKDEEGAQPSLWVPNEPGDDHRELGPLAGVEVDFELGDKGHARRGIQQLGVHLPDCSNTEMDREQPAGPLCHDRW